MKKTTLLSIMRITSILLFMASAFVFMLNTADQAIDPDAEIQIATGLGAAVIFYLTIVIEKGKMI